MTRTTSTATPIDHAGRPARRTGDDHRIVPILRGMPFWIWQSALQPRHTGTRPTRSRQGT